MYKVRRPTRPSKIHRTRENQFESHHSESRGLLRPEGGRGWLLSEKNNSYYFDAKEWINKKLDLRTKAALKQRNAQFAEEHAADTPEQLLLYVRQCAQALRHTPRMEEVIGGSYISYRFGGWTNAVTAAGLPLPVRGASGKGRKIYREELKRQSRLYRQELRKNQEARDAAREERAAADRAQKAAREERDAAWAEAHQTDTDEELLDYLRDCARDLGHSPYSREVVGGSYIAKRMECWAMALYRAELPMAKGMKPPTSAQLTKLRAIQKSCQPGNDPETYKSE